MIAIAKNTNVVWEPIKGVDGRLSSQAIAMLAADFADIILHHGPRGPGKSAGQFMSFRRNVNRGYGKFWRGIIFDREHDNLKDLVTQTKREFPKFLDGAKFRESKGDYAWKWPSGEELLFRHVKKPEDYDGFHGWEIPFIGWNELTKYATRFLYDKMMSINRCSFHPEKDTPKIMYRGELVYNTPDRKPLPPIKEIVYSTTNPNGPGHNWVNEAIVSKAEAGEIYKTETKLENTLTGETKIVVKKQVHIFGNFFENPYLSDEYRVRITQACERDQNLKRAWIFGDWSVNAGGALDDVWDQNTHVINRFAIPDNWYLDRAHDWASTQPYATVWFAESNGEEFELLNGKLWAVPRGTLFAIFEDYGTEGKNTNAGIKKPVREVAEDIKRIESDMQKSKWIAKEPYAGPADNSISSVMADDLDSIEQLFLNEDVEWEKSDKSKGSRISGLQAIRERLHSSVIGEGPGLYFFRNCEYCIHTIPSLPRDEKIPDDVDTEAEDHCYDAVRYRVLKSMNRIATKVPTSWGQ